MRVDVMCKEWGGLVHKVSRFLAAWQLHEQSQGGQVRNDFGDDEMLGRVRSHGVSRKLTGP